ncbi:MAG TPA: CvpA family protein [Chryseosolibacter sp.]|nr:CvpA family protein [Chryseosolibacter sp.]
MSWVDIAILAIVAFGAYKGYRDGFLMELCTLLGIILGIIGGFKLMGVALIYLHDKFDVDDKYLPYIAFGIVFLTILLLVTLLGKALRASIDKTFLGRIDEAAGAGLGLIKTIFVLSVLIWIVSSINGAWIQPWIENSPLLPHIAAFAPFVTDWIGEFIPAFGDVFRL